MATVIRMPEVLANSGEAAIQTWLVQIGQAVQLGEALAEVETEKATVEYAAEVAGVVLQLLVPEGTAVAVGAPIAIVGEPDEVPELVEVGTPGSGIPEPKPVTTQVVTTETPPTSADSHQPVSPIARRIARERGLDIASIRGTGPSGRVVRRDVDGVTSAPTTPAPDSGPAQPTLPSPAGGIDIPHTAMRRAIARRLTESKSTVPHFYLVADCRVDRLLQLRASINEASAMKVSVNDFVLKAAAAAFRAVPRANSTWGETAIRQHESIDISIAVAIDGGLTTPVLRSVDTMTLSEVSQAAAALADRARAGGLRQHEIEGGSMSISNLGMFGVTEFSAIINPPQSAILAVGRARPMPVAEGANVVVSNVMTVTLSADHRVMDGVLAAQWLAAFVAAIESPAATLAGL